jgi:hypothetical protein
MRELTIRQFASHKFLSEGRYVANVVDGKVTLYGR